MAPLIVLVSSVILLWLAGKAGAPPFQDPVFVLRAALALMFLFTASAHWGKRRPDLIRMVPPAFPRPDLLVTLTGVLEILGAIGLFISRTAPAACLCLALLLLAMFPANIHAAREKLTIAGRPVPGLLVRSAIQLLFIAVLVVAGWPGIGK